jgi:hypothetical protein
MSRNINRPVSDDCTCRVFAEKIVTLPIRGRSDGARYESATAVGTDIAQHVFDAGGTERTFIGADACLKGVRRECSVAVLTGGPEF